MADGDERRATTIIIVKKKGGHGGAHGGAWKVAYADFVTAMMAFFLLMWLLGSVPKEQREAVGEYFEKFTVFTEGGRSFIPKERIDGKEGAGKEKAKIKQMGVIDLDPDSIEGQRNTPFETYGRLSPNEFADKLKETVKSSMADIANQVKIDITEDGVRIQLVDREGHDMFAAGSTQPSAVCKRALKVIAEAFRELPNPVALEGHTDATGQNDGKGGNWQLSTLRALAARETLEDEGVDADQFRRVTGKADTEPLLPEDAENSQNRRVAITLLFPKAKGSTEPEHEPENAPSGAPH